MTRGTTTRNLAGRAQTRRGARTACVAAGLLSIVVFVALHGANATVFGDLAVLSLDADWSLPSLWTVALFASAAATWWRLGAVLPGWTGVARGAAVLCALLAIEGLLQLHTRLERAIGSAPNLLVIQPIAGLAVLGLFVACHRRLPSPERHLISAAAGTLVLAQLASTVNGSLDLAHAGIVALQTLEEVMEILTAALLLAAPAGLVVERSRPLGERSVVNPDEDGGRTPASDAGFR